MAHARIRCSQTHVAGSFVREERDRARHSEAAKESGTTHQPRTAFCLGSEHARRNPGVKDRVLVNPATNRPLTRPELYRRVLALAKRAGVQDAHPHRFRDTLAVDMLSRGASLYDVAKVLADTIETVERHYAPFTKELRERVRGLMNNGEGLGKTDCTKVAQSDPTNRIIN